MKQKTLYIIRGIPGSGKSTLAQSMSIQKNIKFFEADMFFMTPAGEYKFDFTKLRDAHEWCQDSVEREMIAGHSVIVSNTFTRWKEIRPYVDLAKDHDYKVKIIHCLGSFQNVHGVPADKLAEMQDRFVPNSNLPHHIEENHSGMDIIYEEYLPVSEVADLSGN